jgi:hypothetical protein
MFVAVSYALLVMVGGAPSRSFVIVAGWKIGEPVAESEATDREKRQAVGMMACSGLETLAVVVV